MQQERARPFQAGHQHFPRVILGLLLPPVGTLLEVAVPKTVVAWVLPSVKTAWGRAPHPSTAEPLWMAQGVRNAVRCGAAQNAGLSVIVLSPS